MTLQKFSPSSRSCRQTRRSTLTSFLHLGSTFDHPDPVKMSQSGDPEIVQAKITAARRDAEGLKDKIKRKKDDLTDATRKSYASDLPALRCLNRALVPPPRCQSWKLADPSLQSAESLRTIPTLCRRST